MHENSIMSGDYAGLIKDGVASANVPTLQMLLVHLTGDMRWIESPYLPRTPPGLTVDDSGGMTDAQQFEIRKAATEAILAWKSGRPIALPSPSRAEILRMISVSVGEKVPNEYADLVASILGITYQPDGLNKRSSPPKGFKALIIGAGVSGICAGVKMQQLGVDFTILERAHDVGGTWQENRYPGCGVDTPSHLYSFSFAPHDWSRYFAKRDELLAYINKVVDEFGLRRHIRFGNNVARAAFSEDKQQWRVDVRNDADEQISFSANILFSAVGAFGSPVIPRFDGADSFVGPKVHTARWPEGLDLSGKRVAVIGNGASAMQVVPELAKSGSEVSLFQRSPQWATPIETNFASQIPDSVRYLLNEVPLYRMWLRIREAWIFNDKAYPVLKKDDAWPDPERSLNRMSDRMRSFLTDYIGTQLVGRPDLIEKAVPTYPVFGKRMLLDHGWYEALRSKNVELVTDPIDAFVSTGVKAAGRIYPVDAIVFATGFDVVHFVSSFEIVGVDGRSLRDVWENDNAKAYLGTLVAGFPNLFLLYGPNTQAGHGGSLIFAVEAQLDYIANLMTQMFEKDEGVAGIRQDVYDHYADSVDAAHDKMVWTHRGMSTYYRNSRGRVVVNSPWRIVDFWRRTRQADLSEFVTKKRKIESETGDPS